MDQVDTEGSLSKGVDHPPRFLGGSIFRPAQPDHEQEKENTGQDHKRRAVCQHLIAVGIAGQRKPHG